jgi:hypothetical protein
MPCESQSLSRVSIVALGRIDEPGCTVDRGEQQEGSRQMVDGGWWMVDGGWLSFGAVVNISAGRPSLLKRFAQLELIL